jgi:outer membrane protein TolC
MNRAPHFRPGWLAVAVALFVAGCATPVPDPVAPTLRKPEDLQKTALAAAVASATTPAGDAWPAAAWWKQFGDAQLDALIDEAFAASPTLELAGARLQAAEAVVAAAGGARQPNLALNAEATRQRFSEHYVVPRPLAGTWRTTARVGADLSFEFDLWGRHAAQLAAAESRADAARFDAAGARLILASALVRAYIAFDLAAQDMQFVEREAARRTAVADLLAARAGAGLTL